jgi:hypothetical protein
MDKNLLRTAVAVAIGGAFSSNLLATDVDQTATPVVPIKVASELTINPTTGSTLGGIGEVKFATGFSIGSTTPRYIRLDIENATWAATQAASAIEVGVQTGVTAANFDETLASGGTNADSFVIYEVVGNGTGNSATSTANVDFTPVTGLTTTSEAGVSISYGLYETAGDAVSQTNKLASDTGALVAFAPANTVAVQSSDVNVSAIDVTVSTATGAVFKNGTATSIIGAYNIVNGTAVENLTGTNATTTGASSTAAIEASSSLTVTGDMTWMQNLDASNVPDGNYDLTDAKVYTTNDCAPANVVETGATSITDSNLVFTTTGNAADVYYVCLTGNGVTAIPEQTFTATYASVGATGYDSETTAMTFGTLAKNGDSQTLNLLLTPGGNFKNFVRISNTSSIAGDVTFSLINDSGDTVSGVALSSVSGQTGSSLSGQSSTGLISVDDLYAAAQAKDATFDAGTGKLRMTVSGNFQSIDVQNISTSNDNNSFDTF